MKKSVKMIGLIIWNLPNPKSPKDVEDKTGVTEAININADPPATTGKDTENYI